MPTLRSIAGAGLVAASLAVMAQAQMSAPGGGPTSRHGRPPYGVAGGFDNSCAGVFGSGLGGSMPFGYQDPVGAARQDLVRLHDQLGITTPQEDRWRAFAVAVLQQAQSMQRFHQETYPAHGMAVVWIYRHADFMRQRADDMALMADAVADLYDVLSAEQRATMDTLVGACAYPHGRPFR